MRIPTTVTASAARLYKKVYSPAQLAIILFVATVAIALRLDRLESLDLMERIRGICDVRNVTKVTLTDAGRSLAKKGSTVLLKRSSQAMALLIQIVRQCHFLFDNRQLN